MMMVKQLLIGIFLILPVTAQANPTLMNGVEKSYYPNGNLAFVQNMRDGKIHGDVKAYYENGKLKGEVKYVNNLEDGSSKEYYPSGKIKEDVLYIDGQMMSLKKFDEQGKLTFSQVGKFDLGCAVVK